MTLGHIIFNHDLMQNINSCNTICHSEKGSVSLEAQKKEIQEVNDGNVLQTYFGDILAKISS